jgi:hypothetical protein
MLQHFAKHYFDNTTPNDRIHLQGYVDARLPLLHQELSDVPIPTAPCPQIHGLRVHHNSLQCKSCKHICTGRTAPANMKVHLRSKHTSYTPPATNNQERSYL